MTEIIAELATGHGGNVSLAEDMIAAAADAGAHTVKIQSYTLAKLNPCDPQRDWLEQSYLDEAAHVRLIKACQREGVQFLSTPFDVDALTMLMKKGLKRFKVASSESASSWWQRGDDIGQRFVVSYPWGRYMGGCTSRVEARLITIPLYPTPLEAMGALPEPKLSYGWNGYSDHTIGTAACKYMISRGAKIIEAHLWTPKSRHMAWDKSPAEFKELRRFADNVETMTTGVATVFRERWRA